jgi:DNA-binding NarL/FixJ family response regulator
VGREWRDVKDRVGKEEQPTVKPRIRAMVVEDSPVAMRALANLLEMHSLIECVGTARDGQEGLKLIEEYEPDFVLVDLEMPGLGGLGLVERLRKKFPAMRLVIVSTHEGHVWQQLSQTHGADAFVTKQRLHNDLAELLHRLFPGHGAGPAMAHKELTK